MLSLRHITRIQSKFISIAVIITTTLDQEEDIRCYRSTLEGLLTQRLWRGICFALALALPDPLLRNPVATLEDHV